MPPFDATTTILLCAMLFYAVMSLYVIGMVLRPLLTTAINGLIDLARQALGVQGGQADSMSTPSRNVAE